MSCSLKKEERLGFELEARQANKCWLRAIVMGCHQCRHRCLCHSIYKAHQVETVVCCNWPKACPLTLTLSYLKTRVSSIRVENTHAAQSAVYLCNYPPTHPPTQPSVHFFLQLSPVYTNSTTVPSWNHLLLQKRRKSPRLWGRWWHFLSSPDHRRPT